MNTSIIVCTHKPYEMPSDSSYLPLQVGAALHDPISGYQGDDKGYSISEKNPLYCELTGLYWLWRNGTAYYQGLVHYRRYFTVKSASFRKKHHWTESVLTSDELSSIIERCQKPFIIVPKKRRYVIETLYSHYSHTLDGSHLDMARDIIKDSCPEYLASFDTAAGRTWGYMWNMFITDRSTLDKYASWLFPILFKMEDKIDLTGLSSFEKRLFGRVSEILFNVWLEHEKASGITVRELRVFSPEPVNWGLKIRSFLAAKLFGKKYEKSF